jgi:sarcosine oxidase, subunit beta
MKAEVVICGAGIAGISAAYALAVEKHIPNVLLVDENAPLSLTSNRSSECYRNWWPGPGDAMVALMNRSIDRMETLARQSGNAFHLNRRGYLYCTADPSAIPAIQQAAEQISLLGAGPLRIHTGRSGAPAYSPAPADGFEHQPEGADLLLDPKLVQAHFPYLARDVVAVLHTRRAGWFSAHQLGMYLLEKCRSHGVRFLSGRVAGIELQQGQVAAVHLKDGPTIQTAAFVNAAGPLLEDVGRMLGIELPVRHELHLKMAIKDTLGVLTRDAPLVIWADAQRLHWSEEERQSLEEDEETRFLLDELPAGLHTRPEGDAHSSIILVLWKYRSYLIQPTWPLPEDSFFPDVALRGLARMLPGMQATIHKMARPQVDGGYYSHTPENRPLIGKLPLPGAFVIGALSGFGLMAACAAGELLADVMTQSPLPGYAPAFALDRYNDPEYQRMLANWGDSGQL